MTPRTTTREPAGGLPSEEADALARAIDAVTFHAAADFGDAPEVAPPRLRRLVVGVDGSEPAEHAVEWAARVAATFGSEVTLVAALVPETVVHRHGALYGWTDVEGLVEAEGAEAREALERAAARLADAGITARIRLEPGAAVRVIVRVAEEERADLVLVGSHGKRGIERFVLGSVAEGVRDHAAASVLVAREPPAPGPLLAPVDGSPPSKAAAALAVRMARAWGERVEVLGVVEPILYGPHGAGARDAMAALRRPDVDWRAEDVTFEVEAGDARTRIVERAEALDAGLVVLGARGLSGLASLVAGSVSAGVARRAPCAVLVVKAV